MRTARLLWLFLFLFGSGHVTAQSQASFDGARQPRILILLDGSASMLQPWDKGQNRFTAAARIISALMDSVYAVNTAAEFGLRVYGHQSPTATNDCYDTRKEVMFSKNNATQMTLRLASIRPAGASSVAYALQETANNDLMDQTRNAYSVILITCTGERCGGDICGAARQLIAAKSYIKPYVISLADDARLHQQCRCLGTCLQVTADRDIVPAIDTIMAVYRPWLFIPRTVITGEPVTRQKLKMIQQQVSIPLQSWMPPPTITFESLPVIECYRLPFSPHHYPLPHTLSTQMPKLPRPTAQTASNRNVLRFVYAGVPNKQVTGFEALLHIQSEPGAALQQSTESAFPYKHGVYYLEVNILPPMRRNITLDTGQVIIAINQPGIVQITNRLPIDKASFFSLLAGRYVRFFDLEITGRPEEQQARFQPGTYEVHWNQKSADGKAKEVITRFSVVSNQVTRLELR